MSCINSASNDHASCKRVSQSETQLSSTLFPTAAGGCLLSKTDNVSDELQNIVVHLASEETVSLRSLGRPKES